MPVSFSPTGADRKPKWQQPQRVRFKARPLDPRADRRVTFSPTGWERENPYGLTIPVRFRRVKRRRRPTTQGGGR